MPVTLTFLGSTYLCLGVWRTPSQTDVTLSRSCDQGKITKGLKNNYGRPSDFLSQISKLSHFNLLDLTHFLMHHYFPVSFFAVATLGVRLYSRIPVLLICASFELRH